MTTANTYANILMPIMGNMGNILYVLLAIVGGSLAIAGVTNISLTGAGVMTLGTIASFLTMSKSFINPIAQVSQQLNAVIMALAGATRIFELLDEESEEDHGYVTLVNAKRENGELVECKERTGLWAWKYPHSDGTLTYEELKGDVVMEHVDFGYEENKLVLHDINLYAEPGQKVAFVGATGAGKTTITNLINRFYDIADGKIRYDGINITKIKKDDLRRSMGVVLQDVNCLQAQLWTISDTASWMPQMKNVLRRQSWPTQTALSECCRMAIRQFLREMEADFPRASVS